MASGASLESAAGVMQSADGGPAIVAGSLARYRHRGPDNAYFGEAGTFGLGIVAQALIELAVDFDYGRDTSPAFDHLPFAGLTGRRQCLSPSRCR
jgi:hypothetical protein